MSVVGQQLDIRIQAHSTVAQAGAGSQTLRSGAVAFNHCV